MDHDSIANLPFNIKTDALFGRFARQSSTAKRSIFSTAAYRSRTLRCARKGPRDQITSRFRRLHLLDHFAKLFQSNVLDLADAFPGHAKLLADFFECLLWSAIEAETGAQDGSLARIEGFDHLLKHSRYRFLFQLFVRRIGALVLNHFGEIVRIFVTNRGVE